MWESAWKAVHGASHGVRVLSYPPSSEFSGSRDKLFQMFVRPLSPPWSVISDVKPIKVNGGPYYFDDTSSWFGVGLVPIATPQIRLNGYKACDVSSK